MNEIHPTAIIDKKVQLGENNKISPYTVLSGPLVIGDNNIIGPHAVIGSPGADTRNPRYDCSEAQIYIGNNNIIREFSAIQKPCYGETTNIGNDVFIMQGANISHNVLLEDKVVLTAMVALAGVCKILEGASLSMDCAIHQRCVVGSYSIVGMGAMVLKNIKPFSRYIPGKPISVNHYAIKKFNFEQYSEEISEYVLKNTLPKSEKIIKLVDHYLTLHGLSENDEYA